MNLPHIIFFLLPLKPLFVSARAFKMAPDHVMNKRKEKDRCHRNPRCTTADHMHMHPPHARLDDVSLSDLAFAMELDHDEPSCEVLCLLPQNTPIEGSCPFLQDTICLAHLSSQEDLSCCARRSVSLSSEDATTDEHHNSSAIASRTSSASSASSRTDHIYTITDAVHVSRGGRHIGSVSKRQRDPGERGRCSSEKCDCTDDDDYKCSTIDLAAVHMWLPAGPVAVGHPASYVYARTTHTHPYNSCGLAAANL
jgi:hypothetical protein